LLTRFSVLVVGCVVEPGLRGGERGNFLGDLSSVLEFKGVWPELGAEIPSPKPAGFFVWSGTCGGGINPAARIAFSSSCLVGSLTGDFGRPGLDGANAACRPQRAFASLTETLGVAVSVVDKSFGPLGGGLEVFGFVYDDFNTGDGPDLVLPSSWIPIKFCSAGDLGRGRDRRVEEAASDEERS
jgi:hypothetical protein